MNYLNYIVKVLNVRLKSKCISDHETRRSSYRREDDVTEAIINEDTPLLHRFPLNQAPERNLVTTITVTSLLMILILGVIIGIYLLILQNNAGK